MTNSAGCLLATLPDGQFFRRFGQTSNRFAGTLAWRSSLTCRITNELRGGLDSGTTIFGARFTGNHGVKW